MACSRVFGAGMLVMVIALVVMIWRWHPRFLVPTVVVGVALAALGVFLSQWSSAETGKTGSSWIGGDREFVRGHRRSVLRSRTTTCWDRFLCLRGLVPEQGSPYGAFFVPRWVVDVACYFNVGAHATELADGGAPYRWPRTALQAVLSACQDRSYRLPAGTSRIPNGRRRDYRPGDGLRMRVSHAIPLRDGTNLGHGSNLVHFSEHSVEQHLTATQSRFSKARFRSLLP